MATRFPECRAKLLAEAEAILEGRLLLFAGLHVQLLKPTNWHRDPLTGEQWPAIHWSHINWHAADRAGDPKMVWEVNRHYHLSVVARALWLTGEARFADYLVENLRSWVEQNAAERGINWASNLEIAVRLLNWLFILPLLVERAEATDSFWTAIAESLWVQAEHLYREVIYTRRHLPNNHLVAEAAALVALGGACRSQAKARRWRMRGLALLDACALEQFRSDGGQREQSSGYHRFVWYLLFLAYMSERRLGVQHPGWAGRLIAAADFVLGLLTPGGNLPPFGDSDDAKPVLATSDPRSSARPLLSCALSLSPRPDMAALAGTSEEALWYCGLDAACFSAAADRASELPSRARAFTGTGLVVCRTGWTPNDRYAMLRFGPHGGHGHADQVHLELWQGERALLTDSGTFTYSGGGSWRDYFRSSAAHNVVEVDGEGQSRPHRVFHWRDPLQGRLEGLASTPQFDYVRVSHDGYRRLTPPVRHVREVVACKAGVYFILDRLISNGPHSYTVFWHFAPEVRPADMPGDSHDFRLPFRVSSTAQISVQLQQGVPAPPAGWYSPSYGERVARLRLEARTPVQHGCVTFLTVVATDASTCVESEHQRKADGTSVLLGSAAAAGSTLRFVYRGAPITRAREIDGYEATSQLYCVHEDSGLPDWCLLLGPGTLRHRMYGEPATLPLPAAPKIRVGTWPRVAMPS